MALYVLCYDIHKPYTEYEGLEEKLRSMDAKRVQESVWAFNSDIENTMPAFTLRRMFQEMIRLPGDRVAVMRVSDWSTSNPADAGIEKMPYYCTT
jgi:CRISPR/Cas system-associated endoribonuclease Cas2